MSLSVLKLSIPDLRLEGIDRNERRKTFKPQTGRLLGVFPFVDSELPRLDDLIRFPVSGTHDADRILNGDAIAVRKRKMHKEHNRLISVLQPLLCFVSVSSYIIMPIRGDREICARWESDQQVPRPDLCVCVCRAS